LRSDLRRPLAGACVPAADLGAPLGHIRLGYFSADFHNHATMHLIAELLERHDRARFEVFAFSFGAPSEDVWRRRAEAAVDRFIDVGGLDDDRIAALSRELGVTIAVDLKGFTEGARPGIFAAGAAPLQLSYLGYPGTMAAPFIDYVVADEVTISASQRPWFSEHVICLPRSYQANVRKRDVSTAPVTRADQGLPEQGFVFCCFNNARKIGPEVFAVWMDVLRETAGSVLWLLVDNEQARQNLRAATSAQAVAPDRLIFAGQMPIEDHLARQALAELFLDSLPYNAHTTASDALRMGVPVLTCPGTAFASRVAASLLADVGLEALIAPDLAAYRELACVLARDPDRLRQLRGILATKLSDTLLDSGGFARDLEAGFEAIYARLVAGLPPSDIRIRPGFSA
jgi:predicted O-linked N-acetylglucosamine transferase (SPINDLY family)